jgi:hypothetical protein
VVARLTALVTQERTTLREDLVYVVTVTSAPCPINYRVRADGTIWNKTTQTGDIYTVDGRLIDAIWLDPAAATINVTVQAQLDVGWILRQGNASALGPVTVGPAATFGPAVVPPATAETTEASLSGLALGEIVHYELDGSAAVAADASVLIWIALKGASTGIYYAVCRANPVFGSFVVNTAEVINLVVKNASAATGYQMHGYVEARIGANS